MVDHIDQLARTKKDDPDRAKKIGEFGVRFTQVAFRRPFTEQERIYFVDKRYQEAKTLEDAVRRLVLLVLTSPRFLYPDTSFDETHSNTPWAKVSSLSLTLWDSVASRELNEKFRKGEFNAFSRKTGRSRLVDALRSPIQTQSSPIF